MKIALVAMSGIRVCDAELLRMGLTLPGFVERSKTIASLPSLGLLTLAGMTPEDHEVHYIEIDDLKKKRETEGLPLDHDLVAISTYSAQVGEAYELADECRRAGVPVVMGGPHVSVLPAEALRHCDAVVVGEGELSWDRVLKDAERGDLQRVYGSQEEEFDLAQAPMPDFRLLDMGKYNRLTVQTSRGCPHRCEFCASSVIISRRYKQKPADKVMAEVDSIVEVWRHPFIEFADDNTFVDRAYWKELLPRLALRRFRWFTETDVSVAEDEELLHLMREAGCAQVLVGLESPNAAGLDGLEAVSNWKLRRLDSYMRSIDAIQSAGISVNGCFVLGLDGQGTDIFDEVFTFVKDSGLHEVQITIETPFPGTALYDRLAREGRLLAPEAWERCTLFDLNFRPEGMTAEELTEGFRELGQRLYSEEFTNQRRRSFRHRLKQSRSH